VSQFFYLFGILLGGILCTQLLTRLAFFKDNIKMDSELEFNLEELTAVANCRFSPRSILIAGLITQIIAGIAVAQAPQFELHVFLRFLTAFACVNMFTSGYAICEYP
jgi:MFS family permease